MGWLVLVLVFFVGYVLGCCTRVIFDRKMGKDPVKEMEDSIDHIGAQLFDGRTLTAKHQRPTGNQPHHVDQTKRRSLQPGNELVMAAGLKVNLKGEIVKDKGPKEYNHQFYGTQFEHKGKVLIHSLPKKLHRIEIMKDDTVYIDGARPFHPLHPADLEVLKAAIVEANGE